MKFLGLRLCEHDSNLAFADGARVRCYKSERHNQIKHHGYDNLTEWASVLTRWNITVGDLDAGKGSGDKTTILTAARPSGERGQAIKQQY